MNLFSFLAEQKFHLSLQPHFAEVAQLVEHNLAPKDYKVTTLARGKQHRQTANAKEYNAEVAQLVEHNLAKVGVAGSSPVFRSRKKIVGSNGGIGRHEGLKIPWPVMAVRVQVPLRVHSTLLSLHIFKKKDSHTTSFVYSHTKAKFEPFAPHYQHFLTISQ